MVSSKAVTVKEYLAALNPQQQPVVTKLYELFKHNLPTGYEELMQYGMITFIVPKSIYPPGYHVKPHPPLPFVSIAAQKNFVAIYHMGLYGATDILGWFQQEYTKTGFKLDMGKSCIRLKHYDRVPYELFARLAGKITVEEYLKHYTRYITK
jgi:uncharacterized protein YdhG (YjbR/CyaY superfamily)